jgi:dihydroflavonol-4-reductase
LNNKVLLTGANSLLGANVIRALLERNYEVRAFIRSSSNISAISDLHCEFFKGDITRFKDLKEAVQDCDYVIHAATNNDLSPTSLDHYYNENVKAVRLLIKSCQENGVRRIVYISTANTFDPGNRSSVGTEKNTIAKDFQKSGYAMSKFLAQEMVVDEVKKGKLNAIVINPSFIIGPFDTKPTSGRIIIRYFHKKLILLPPGGKSFIYSKDVANAVCNALVSGRPGECYLVTNQNLSYLEFFRKLENITHNKSMKIILPRRIIILMGGIGTVLTWFGLKMDLNLVNARNICKYLYYDSGKAIEDLGLTQTPIEIAINEAIMWFKENGYLQ